ncbi:hypothetical protein LCGC14_2105100 [marine sediment metagenome]|uniref:Uncharacterized protein n=1 Tax=marine sediment metagenome TaxID=412755 RepID=A0A0F9GLY2_9ZZZZ
MATKRRQIEISFPVEVELSREDMIDLDKIALRICKRNTPTGYVMWPSGAGSRITYMPMTLEEEKHRGTEWDDSVYSIDCSIKEKR